MKDCMQRTIDSLIGLRMEARDGEVGKVEDIYFDGPDGELGRICNFVIDDQTWKLLNLVVNTGLPPEGKKVLVAVDHIIQMRWSDSEIYLSETKADIESSTLCSLP
jgi:hypothetical protein